MSTKQTKINTGKVTTSKSPIPKIAIAGAIITIGAGSLAVTSVVNQVQTPVIDDNSAVFISASEENPLAKELLARMDIRARSFITAGRA